MTWPDPTQSFNDSNTLGLTVISNLGLARTEGPLRPKTDELQTCCNVGFAPEGKWTIPAGS